MSGYTNYPASFIQAGKSVGVQPVFYRQKIVQETLFERWDVHCIYTCSTRMVHHRGASLSEQQIVLIYVMAHKPRATAGFMIVYCQSA